jgi:hypothetical protein
VAASVQAATGRQNYEVLSVAENAILALEEIKAVDYSQEKYMQTNNGVPPDGAVQNSMLSYAYKFQTDYSKILNSDLLSNQEWASDRAGSRRLH